MALALVASLFVALVPSPAHAATQRQIRNRLYEKINNSRDNRDLRLLKRNDRLQTEAQEHARWMANNCKPSQVPMALLGGCHDVFRWGEYTSRAEWGGENIARLDTQSGIASVTHKAFMQSQGHCANILTRQATHMGVGVVKSNGVVYVVERFADRRNSDGDDPLGMFCNWLL